MDGLHLNDSEGQTLFRLLQCRYDIRHLLPSNAKTRDVLNLNYENRSKDWTEPTEVGSSNDELLYPCSWFMLENLEILQWVSDKPYVSQHYTARQLLRQYPEGGKWILQRYTKWLNSSGSRAFWLRGTSKFQITIQGPLLWTFANVNIPSRNGEDLYHVTPTFQFV